MNAYLSLQVYGPIWVAEESTNKYRLITKLRNEEQPAVVMRSYAEFKWLLGELQIEEPFVVIPPIPKHISFLRFLAEDNAKLQARFKDLQFFLEYVVQHGRLSQKNCLERFLTPG